MSTDTRAALDAAIDDYGNATAREADNKTERTAIDRAIAAHVEAEVARRLAAAPEVDEAIGDFDDVCSSLMRVRCEETPPDAREPAEWDESLLELYRERKADLLAAIAADKARAVAAARPTPDEARRLVDALWRALAGDVSIPPRRGKTAAITALLRALGVEA